MPEPLPPVTATMPTVTVDLHTYYAAQAMNALITAGTSKHFSLYRRIMGFFFGDARYSSINTPAENPTALAAYAYADAMMKMHAFRAERANNKDVPTPAA